MNSYYIYRSNSKTVYILFQTINISIIWFNKLYQSKYIFNF